MSTDRLLFDLVRASGKRITKQLPTDIYRSEEDDTFYYRQLLKSHNAFFYEVTNQNTKEVHYEVFRRSIHPFENRELYPWEETVEDTLQTTKNNAAAMQMWIAMMNEDL